jgi:AcrR family transcriptional regulator
MVQSAQEKTMPKIIPEKQIFQAVIETISKHGYAGATTRLIAETAGIGEVTLFRKHGTKAELVKWAIAALVEQSEFESATHYTGDLHADLQRILRAYEQSVISKAAFFMVLFTEIQNTPELANAFTQPMGLYRATGQLLMRYQEQGVLKAENPLHSVASLLGPLIYISMISQTIGTGELLPLDLETHIAHFLNGRYIS